MEKYGENPTPQQRSAATKERRKLFALIEELVKWENTNNEDVLKKAREKILESCPEGLPAFHDPFAGGGALPLEAQRLGLESYASDLNPVAVMINKAMIEIPPKFAGRKPVGPVPVGEVMPDVFKEWPGATGLAEDVRRYGYWMREEAKKYQMPSRSGRERRDLQTTCDGMATGCARKRRSALDTSIHRWRSRRRWQRNAQTSSST